jgi:hypothetical protein
MTKSDEMEELTLIGKFSVRMTILKHGKWRSVTECNQKKTNWRAPRRLAISISKEWILDEEHPYKMIDSFPQ